MSDQGDPSKRTPWDWIVDEEFLRRRSFKVFVLTGFLGGCIDGSKRIVDLGNDATQRAITP